MKLAILIAAATGALSTVGCTDLHPTPHDTATRVHVGRFMLANSGLLAAICPVIAPYLQARSTPPTTYTLSGNAGLAMSYDGTLVTGVSCTIKAHVDGFTTYGQVAIDVCEKSPAMATIRRALAAHDLAVPDGCDNGPRYVARIRSRQLQRADKEQCLYRILSKKCEMLEIELNYYRNIFKGLPYGAD